MKKSEIKLRRLVFILSMIAALSVTIGGYIHYSSLREFAIEREHSQESKQLKDMRDQIDLHLTWSLKSVKALAGLKELEHLLVSGDAASLAGANTILDHFHGTMQASVCYLMDRSGNTIASSNRNTPVSFVGKNYGFRAYFQQAMQGFPTIYMALGVTSKKRGIYFSHPVYGKGKEGPLGVVVIKASVEMISKGFMKSHDGIVLLTDPHGVVFASDREEWLYHVLWEVSSDKISEIAKTRQFGKGPWDWTGVKQVGKDHAVDNLGNDYHMHREEIANYPGWHLVSLHDHHLVSKKVTESLLGTVGFSTLALCVLIGLFVFSLYKKTSSEIFQRARAEEALRKSEERFRVLTAMSPTGIYQTGVKGDYIYVNERWCEMAGLSPEEAAGQGWIKGLHPEDRELIESEWSKMVESEGKWGLEYRFQNLDGKIIWAYGVAAPLRDDDGTITGYMGVNFDHTERKALEEELLKSRKLESVGLLAGGMAHDFNNLLSIILGNIELAENDIKPEVGVSDFLKEAVEASLRAQELTRQLITFSKGGAPVKSSGSIGNLVKKSTNYSISGSNAESEFSIPYDPWLVEFDEGQMKHAINNMIANAVESMPDGGRIAVKAENFVVSSESLEQSLPLPEGKYVKITIRDQGIGIPEEHLSMVFDPYFSTKEMGTQKGMGLGLATTYSIINRHDGHITVESEIGVGTTFTIYLPAHEKEVVALEPIEIPKPERLKIHTGKEKRKMP